METSTPYAFSRSPTTTLNIIFLFGPQSNINVCRKIECFDIIARWNDITTAKRSGPNSAAVDLTRLVTMLWVVLGNSFAIRTLYHQADLADMVITQYWIQDWNITLAMQGMFGVSVF